MNRRYILPTNGNNPLDDFIDDMYESCVYIPSAVLEMEGVSEEAEKYLGDYLLEDHNDVCFVDKVGYIPFIDKNHIDSNEKNIIQLMEFEKLTHDLNIDVDSYKIRLNEKNGCLKTPSKCGILVRNKG